MILTRRLSELRAIVLRELDALADGDRSTTWTTLEELSTSLGVAVEQAQELEVERDRAERRRVEVEARAEHLARRVLRLRRAEAGRAGVQRGGA